jgi:hypothetical protein
MPRTEFCSGVHCSICIPFAHSLGSHGLNVGCYFTELLFNWNILVSQDTGIFCNVRKLNINFCLELLGFWTFSIVWYSRK